MPLTLQQMAEQQDQERWRLADQARGNHDVMKMLGISARQLRLPMDEVVARYNDGRDGVVVESDASKTGYALREMNEGAAGRRMLEMIDERLGFMRVDRAYRISRSRMSDLSTQDRAVRDLDVAVQDTVMAEVMERIEQEVLPTRVLGWVDEKANATPAFRRTISTALKARDEKFLEQVLITTRFEPGPSGRLVQIDEVAMWDRVSNPRLLGETLVQRYGPGARQRNMLEVLKVERTRALLEARGYPVEASTIGRIENVAITHVDGAQ